MIPDFLAQAAGVGLSFRFYCTLTVSMIICLLGLLYFPDSGYVGYLIIGQALFCPALALILDLRDRIKRK
jgi:hypothetical protein